MRTYPSPEETCAPYIPGAPLLTDDCDPASVGYRLYQTACEALYGRCSRVSKSDLTTIQLAMLQLQTLEIKPAEWVIHRLRVFALSELSQRLPRPPVNFVFSIKAMTDKPFDSGELLLPRLVVTPAMRHLVKTWNRCRKSGIWSEYDSELLAVIEQNKKIQKQLEDRVDAGDFIWLVTL